MATTGAISKENLAAACSRPAAAAAAGAESQTAAPRLPGVNPGKQRSGQVEPAPDARETQRRQPASAENKPSSPPPPPTPTPTPKKGAQNHEDSARPAPASAKRLSFSFSDPNDEEVHFSRIMLTASGHPVSIDSQLNLDQFLSYPTATATATTTTTAQAAAPAAFRDQEQARSSRLLDSIGSRLRRGSSFLVAPKLVGQYLLGITIQSWTEFFNTARLRKPPLANTHQLARRVLSNLSHFQGNYLCVSLVLVIYCILTSPLLLLAIIGYLAALYAITARKATGHHLRLFNQWQPNLQQQYSCVTLLALPLLWVAGAPSAFFWVIGASFVVVGLHASLHCNPKELSLLAAPATQPSALHFRPHLAPLGVHSGSPPTGAANYRHCWQFSAGLSASANAYGAEPMYANVRQQYLPVPCSTFAGHSAAALAPRSNSLLSISDNKNNNNNNNNSASSDYQQLPGNSYASSFSHWIPFAAAGDAPAPTGAFGRKMKWTSADAYSRLSAHEANQLPAELNIVSQDFAGLGRVYEI